MRFIFFPRWRAAAVLSFGLLAWSLAGRIAAAPSEGPVRATQEEQALMQAIFGDDYESETGSALRVIKVKGENDYFLMTVVGFTRLPDGRTVVAVNGHPSDANGADAAAHASPGMLNLYVLRRVVEGRIRIADNPQGGAYRDILVDFSGKEYGLVSGTNPVPGI